MKEKKFLIVRAGALGDLIYATTVIEAILLQYGKNTKIDFICKNGMQKLFEFDNRIDKIFTIKHKKIPIIFSNEKKNIINYSKIKPYDYIINFEYDKYFINLINKINAKYRLGTGLTNCDIPNNINRAEQLKYFYNSIINNQNLSNSYPKIITPYVNIKKEFNLDENYMVVSPSNSHVNKKGINYRAWENNKWKELLEKISKKTQVIVVGAKNEEKFFKQLKPYPQNVIDLVGKTNLIQLTSIIREADGVVCTDSAIGHMSASVNTPVYILMGPNDIVTDSPYKTPYNKVFIISKQLECSPCYNQIKKSKRCKDNVCMKNIEVEDVLIETEKLDIRTIK